MRAQRHGNMAWVRTWTFCLAIAPLACDKPSAQRDASSDVATPASMPSPVQLRDVTVASGIDFAHVRGASGDYALPELIGPGGAFFDYDDDGDLDIYLVQGGALDADNHERRNKLFRNDGDRFADVSSTSGADVSGYGFGAAAADFDNDGDIDLYVTRIGPNVLLRNRGDGTFEDVSAGAGVDHDGFGVSAAFFDYDRDGLLDLYVVNYVKWSKAMEHACYGAHGLRDYCAPGEYPSAGDKLYRNLGDGRFEDVSEASGIASIERDGLGVVAVDVDRDGWLDIYVANDQMPAFCWINQKDGTFMEDAQLRGCAVNEHGIAIAGMGIAVEDIDGNGYDDLFVTNIAMQTHLFMTNKGGFFEDRTRRFGLSHWNKLETGFGVAWIDLENDGVPELLVANGGVNRSLNAEDPERPYAQRNQLARRDAEGNFELIEADAVPALASLEVSRGVICGDYDNDGDIDALITNNGASPQLLRNESQNKNNWVRLSVRDPALKRAALNARVLIEAGGKTFRKTVRRHAGYLGSNDSRVHFGLGNAATIDKVVVTWPDGVEQSFGGLAVNKTHTLLKKQ